MREKSKDLIGFAVAVVLIGVIFNVFEWMGRSGWIFHTERAVVIYPKQGWEVGEYNYCKANRDVGDKKVLLNCAASPDDWGAVRDLNVRFWGKVWNQPTRFECQRGEANLVCHAGPEVKETPAVRSQ